jgi:hypothetical protein
MAGSIVEMHFLQINSFVVKLRSRTKAQQPSTNQRHAEINHYI